MNSCLRNYRLGLHVRSPRSFEKLAYTWLKTFLYHAWLWISNHCIWNSTKKFNFFIFFQWIMDWRVKQQTCGPLGFRSKSQDAMRGRKVVRFNDESSNRPRSNSKGQISGNGSTRSFFLLSMLQGDRQAGVSGDPSSSSGRQKSSKVSSVFPSFLWLRVSSVI